MKKIILLCIVFTMAGKGAFAQKYEYKIITSIESVIPNGLGRSRLVNVLETKDYKNFTSVRSEDDKTQNKADRSEVRLDNFEETKLLNFFNIGGIRFQNIASNDAIVASRINTMIDEGWDLAFVTSGVESPSQTGAGIFITRYIFKRPK